MANHSSCNLGYLCFSRGTIHYLHPTVGLGSRNIDLCRYVQCSHLLQIVLNSSTSHRPPLVRSPPCPIPGCLAVLSVGAHDWSLPPPHCPLNHRNALRRRNDPVHPHRHHRGKRPQTMGQLGLCSLGLAAHRPIRQSSRPSILLGPVPFDLVHYSHHFGHLLCLFRLWSRSQGGIHKILPLGLPDQGKAGPRFTSLVSVWPCPVGSMSNLPPFLLFQWARRY